MKDSKKIITRFPPSPTGFLHLGGARTALFNYLFAKHHGGEMIFRIEDTDTLRSKKEFEDNIIESLNWLGISIDTIYRQSERTEIYTRYIKQLLDSGHAYLSEETEGEKRQVIRFKNPNKVLTFTDFIRGEISIDTTDLGDFVIAKDMQTPVYHLAVVTDDFEMNISHVIRGEDHISNTPRQMLIQEALGMNRPYYAHIPLILGPDKKKLSKRHGAESVTEYRRDYLPEAMVNFLALLGWHPKGEQELFTLSELIEVFDLKRVGTGGAIFDETKLQWLNREHVKQLSENERSQLFTSQVPETVALHPHREAIFTLLEERMEKLSDLKTLPETEFSYLFTQPEYEKEKLSWKDDDVKVTKEHIEAVIKLLGEVTPFTKETSKEALWDYATEKGRGSVLWPFRYALSGKEKSPDPFTLAEILGYEETINRLKKALTLLS